MLVPVALSASHIAFNSIRMEPTWMILGQSAGAAASMYLDQISGSVQDVNVTSLRAKLRLLGQILEPRKNIIPSTEKEYMY